MSQKNPPSSKSRKRSKMILLGCLLVTFYAVMGFLVIPKIIHPMVEEQLSKHLDRKVSLERIQLNPFTLSGTLDNFLIVDHDNAPLFSLKKSYANFQILSILTQNWTFKEISIEEPYGRIVVNKDRSLNVSDLLEKLTNQAPDEMGEKDEKEDQVRLTIGHLVIMNGVFAYTDHSLPLPFETVAKPINIDLRDFGTSSDTEAPYAFSATTESGESFSWEGDVLLNPIRSSGRISISNISLPKYKPFHYGLINLQVTEGKLSFDANYQYDLMNDVRLSNGSITFSDLLMQTSGSDIDVLNLESVQLEGAAINLKKQTAEINSVVIHNGHIQVERMEGGTLDVEGIIPATEEPSDGFAQEKPASEKTEPAGTNISEWAVLLRSFQIEDSSLALIDNSLQDPTTLAFDDIQLAIENISNKAEQTANLSLTTRSRHGGAVRTKGTFSLLPVEANLDITLDALNLEALNHHVNEQADVEIKSGDFNLTGKITLSSLENTNEPNLHFSGNVNISDFKAVDGRVTEDLIAWTDFAVSAINYTHLPAALEIGKIVVSDPSANVFVDEAGVFNVSSLDPEFEVIEESVEEDGVTSEENTDMPDEKIEDTEEVVEKVEPEAAPPLPFPVEIAKISILNGSINFLDKSVDPSVSFLMDDFKGTITGLQSDEASRADIDLSGRLNNSSLLTITGQANPLAAVRYVDLQIDLNNFELPPLGSYFGKYVGYGLEKGQFSVGMTYTISGSELNGENQMKVDQLTLSEKTDSPDAPNLPIPLALSLLKDRNGLIELDVPVSGNLNDPSFSYGSVISKAIINVITKVVTSPFSILGSLVGGSSDGAEFKYVSFDPGTSDLSGSAQEKLDKLAEALFKRPNLRLEILGGIDGQLDKIALQQQKLDALLQNPEVLQTVMTQENDKIAEDSAVGNPLQRGFARVKSWITFSAREEQETAESGIEQEEEAVLGLEDMEVTNGELQELAFARGNSVKAYLLSTEKVETDRLFLTIADTKKETIGSGKAQVDFLLK